MHYICSNAACILQSNALFSTAALDWSVVSSRITLLIEGINLMKCDIRPTAWETSSASLVFPGAVSPIPLNLKTFRHTARLGFAKSPLCLIEARLPSPSPPCLKPCCASQDTELIEVNRHVPKQKIFPYLQTTGPGTSCRNYSLRIQV